VGRGIPSIRGNEKPVTMHDRERRKNAFQGIREDDLQEGGTIWCGRRKKPNRTGGERRVENDGTKGNVSRFLSEAVAPKAEVRKKGR